MQQLGLATKEDWDLVVLEDAIMIGFTPTLHPQDATNLLENNFGDWIYPGEEGFDLKLEPTVLTAEEEQRLLQK